MQQRLSAQEQLKPQLFIHPISIANLNLFGSQLQKLIYADETQVGLQSVAPCDPATKKPLADIWDVNHWIALRRQER